jgi:CRISPR-associated protein Cmr4
MFEKTRLLFIYAVSPVHVGAGQAIGIIDNPIQRERHTRHPSISGSGLKGAMRHHLEVAWKVSPQDGGSIVARVFGPPTEASDYAGAVSFGDAQLVAFPVRSLKRAFVYAVSPVTLARLKRLALLAGMAADWAVPQIGPDRAEVVDPGVLSDSRLVLEAFEFEPSVSANLESVARWLAAHAMPAGDGHDHFRRKLETDLVCLSDDVFSQFVENATLVEPHVRINNDSGTADEGGLFYTESLPPESLLVSPVSTSLERISRKGREGESLRAEQIMQTLVEGPGNGDAGLDGALAQVGGDATTGRGQVVLRFA